jgi:RNA polymerase sigma-70 factor (ECF subfamily)
VNDNEIIERSLKRPAEFASLYERHAASVFRYAVGRVGRDVADDIMSETFLVAFDRRASFDVHVVDARPWLFGIATTLVKKHGRLEARAWKGLLAEHASTLPMDVVEAIGSRIDAERAVGELAHAIRGLKRGDRDVLLLHAWGNLDYRGIAEALGIPVGTVRSRLNRARRLLHADVPEVEVDHGSAHAASQGA